MQHTTFCSLYYYKIGVMVRVRVCVLYNAVNIDPLFYNSGLVWIGCADMINADMILVLLCLVDVCDIAESHPYESSRNLNRWVDQNLL